MKAEHDDATRVARLLRLPVRRCPAGPRSRPTACSRTRTPTATAGSKPGRRGVGRLNLAPREAGRPLATPGPGIIGCRRRRGFRHHGRVLEARDLQSGSGWAHHPRGRVLHGARRGQGRPGRAQRRRQDQLAEGPGGRRPACRGHGQDPRPAGILDPGSPCPCAISPRDPGCPTSCRAGASTRRPTGWKSSASPWRSTPRTGDRPFRRSRGPFHRTGWLRRRVPRPSAGRRSGARTVPDRPAPGGALGRGAPAGRAGPHPLRRHRRSHARRTHQPSRQRRQIVADGVPPRFSGGHYWSSATTSTSSTRP